ncbi:BatA domain-containing protein [Patiriisocius sp. Uisw_017]|jgi:hypothetical protein|uniref:BatA domain-containing protein n=1 Tax=Patiriisocius sp. Uisw_017 TaxID=3230968 RepID=UPI0039E7325C
MQFKHPEILYALFLLLIPIFIHLFQLRRFQKVAFTNVAFLKKVSIQTRKSSQLKKWLTLLTRLLALAAIIIAFAQPFKASKTALNANKETVLYIDNSYSMEAKGANGALLQRAIQDVYVQLKDDQKISFFTNTTTKKNIAVPNLKNNLLETGYTQKQFTPSQILLKAAQLFSKDKSANKRLIVISDFQQKEVFPEIPEHFKVDVVQLKAANITNVAIDSVYVKTTSGNKTQLEVLVSANNDVSSTIPVSLYNGAVLMAKTAVNFSESKSQKINFDFENTDGFKGSLILNDTGLSYDNKFYFSVNKPEKIKVLSINKANSSFLQRLFNDIEFQYTAQDSRNLDYSIIPKQNCIILNELTGIPASLTAALNEFSKNGGTLLIIPNNEANLTGYNVLLNGLRLGTLNSLESKEKKIAKIIFDHPIYKEVFEKRVVNFQFPKVNSFFITNTLATSILKFEDEKPFIIASGNAFLATAAFNDSNSNFTSSPLIVPTLYNIARQSLQLPQLYYTIGNTNTYAVPVSLIQDEILSLKDSITSIIPLQQTKTNKVLITTDDEPAVANNYTITKGETGIKGISYNYSRAEGALVYLDTKNWNGVKTHRDIPQLFESIEEENNITEFWKWFAIAAFLFLLIEMLLLKFYKK